MSSATSEVTTTKVAATEVTATTMATTSTAPTATTMTTRHARVGSENQRGDRNCRYERFDNPACHRRPSCKRRDCAYSHAQRYYNMCQEMLFPVVGADWVSVNFDARRHNFVFREYKSGVQR
ncbi:MAG: hypothetical protein WBL77_09110, partial [Pseudolabrys sp.]